MKSRWQSKRYYIDWRFSIGLIKSCVQLHFKKIETLCYTIDNNEIKIFLYYILFNKEVFCNHYIINDICFSFNLYVMILAILKSKKYPIIIKFTNIFTE